MGVARQDDVDLARRALDQRPAQLRERAAQLERARPQPEQEVGRDLVVAAAAGVELARERADQREQPPLHVRVYVLQRGVELERAGRDLLRDPLERLAELLPL